MKQLMVFGKTIESNCKNWLCRSIFQVKTDGVRVEHIESNCIGTPYVFIGYNYNTISINLLDFSWML